MLGRRWPFVRRECGRAVFGSGSRKAISAILAYDCGSRSNAMHFCSREKFSEYAMPFGNWKSSLNRNACILHVNSVRHLNLSCFRSSHVLLLRLPGSGISRPHPLIQTNTHSILRIDLAIKRRFEISMRAQTLLDIATPTSLRPQLQRFKPFDIFAIKEHITDRDEFLVDLVRVAG